MDKEQKIIEEAEAILESSQKDSSPDAEYVGTERRKKWLKDDFSLRTEYSSLLKHYKKMSKKLNRMVKLTDMHQNEMNALNQELEHEKDHFQKVSEQISNYISPQIYDMVFKGEKDVKLENSRKKLTIFFSDVAGFTALTEQLDPETMTSVLNHYLEEMSDIVLKHGGTLDKFIGDAIMVFFGDPVSHGDQSDAVAAVNMALDMRAKMNELREEWARDGVGVQLQIRMGINTGFCTVGNFGSKKRMDYTILGSQVNLASRMESVANEGEILISEDTYNLVKSDVCCFPKVPVSVKGIAQPVQTYQVMDYYNNLPDVTDLFKVSSEAFSVTANFTKIGRNDLEKTHLLSVLQQMINLVEYRK